jgi:hypothetical protein
LFPGFRAFLQTALENGVPLFVVSHKSEFAAAAPDGTNLRDAARAWMTRAGLIGSGGIDEGSVFFEGTRGEKIARIVSLQCSHFIDDLREVFDEPAFPSNVGRLLFAPGCARRPTGPFAVFGDWDAITRELFGALVRR